MKLLKRFLILILCVFALLIGIIAIIGTQYKDEVVSFVKNELSKKLTREVKVGKIEYNLFSNFPNISVDLINLETYSFKPGDIPFFQLNKVHLVFDIMPLIKGDFQIGEIILEEGQVNVINDAKQNVNFNILKETADSNSSKSLFSIEILRLKNIEVTYQNWKELQSYSVSFQECSVFPSSIIESIDASIIFSGKIPSLDVGGFTLQKSIDLEGDFKIGLSNDSLIFNYLGQFGSGDIDLDGRIYFHDKKEDWDIKFNLLNQDISHILSAIPPEFKADVLNTLKGDISADIKIIGEKIKDNFPPLKVYFDFSNGFIDIKNNTLKGIFLKGSYFQPNISSINGAMVIVDKYSLKCDGIVINGKGKVSDFKNPLISAKIKSNFNLRNLHKIFSEEEFKNLSGDVNLDLDFSGKIKEIFITGNKLEINNFRSNGFIKFSDVIAQPADFNYPMKIDSGLLNVSNQDLVFDSFKGKILSSSFYMNGRIKSFLETVLQDQPLIFYADLKMDKMILEDFIAINSDSTSNQEIDYNFNLPKSVSLNTNLDLGFFSFRAFRANDIKGKMLLSNQQLSFRDLNMKTCDGKALLNGDINTKNPSKIVFKCESKFENIDAKKAFTQFENFGQDVLRKKHVKGRVSLSNILLAESDKKLNILEEKIYTETQLKIDQGELIYFEPLVELQDFLNEEFKLNFNLNHLKFETLRNNIKIKNGVINIPEMSIRSSDINLDISGTHTFNQDIDYLLKIKHNEIFKAHKQNKIDEEFGVVENNDKTATLPLRMKGNIDDPKFTYDTKIKRSLISESWKTEGKTIKKVFREEFSDIFKSKKNKKKSPKLENEILNNTSSKIQTIITWDEEDEED